MIGTCIVFAQQSPISTNNVIWSSNMLTGSKRWRNQNVASFGSWSQWFLIWPMLVDIDCVVAICVIIITNCWRQWAIWLRCICFSSLFRPQLLNYFIYFTTQIHPFCKIHIFYVQSLVILLLSILLLRVSSCCADVLLQVLSCLYLIGECNFVGLQTKVNDFSNKI